MKPEFKKELQDYILSKVDKFPLHKRFTGRAMYGKKCVGIACEKPYKFISELLQHFSVISYEECNLINDAIDFISNTKEDYIANDKIIYWDNFQWEEFQQ